MGKAGKRQKKFIQKGGLQAAIKHRRTGQKVRRAKAAQADRAGKRAPGDDSGSEDEGQQPRKALEDMSIDEFLQGGFMEAAPAGGAGPGDASDDSDLSDSDPDLGGSSEEEEDEQQRRPAGKQQPAAKQQQQQQQQQAVGKKRKQAEAPPPAESEEEEEESDGEPVVSDDEDFEDEEGSEDEGSDEEDDEEASEGSGSEDEEAAPAGKGKGGGGRAALKREMEEHKAQLERLRQQDPEFFAYLQSTDQELLNFGRDSDDEMDSEEEEEGEEEEREVAGAGAGAPPAAQQQQRSGVTLAMVEGWCAAAREKASMGAVRNIIKAYRAACHYGDSEEEVEESMRIASSAVYNKLMLFVLREIDGIFRRMLLEGASAKQQAAPLTAAALVKLPRWRKVDPLVKSYLGNTLHLLGALTDGAMLTFILRRVRASTVMLAPYEKLQRKLLKAALGLFGSADNAPRVQAILLVRQMALELPQPALDNCLKGVYRAFCSNAKFVNAASLPQINFMGAAVIEMYGINPTASYQHAFGFIRQLAVLLRTALTSKSKEAFREVYCWQTINSLELWAKLLAAKADEPELRPLIYPVCQLLLGVARLVPAPAHFPLRLRCARALNRLGEATRTFIPVAPVLLEVLQWGDLRRAPKPGPGQQPDVLLTLRASTGAMRSAQYQEEIINQVMELLAEHLGCWGCHIAFPELAFLTTSQLRKFMKTSPVDRFKKAAKGLVEAVERNTAWVGRQRDQVDFSPKDLAQVATFLAKEDAAKQAPIQQYARSLQERARQRLQLRLADEMPLGTGASDSDDEAVPEGSLLPSKQRKAAAEQEADAPAAKRQKQEKQRRQAAAAADSSEEEQGSSDEEGGSGSDEDIQVRPYQLSDDEGDEEGGYAAPHYEPSDDEEEEDESEEEDDERPRKQQQQQQQRQQQQQGGRGGRGGGGGGRGQGRGGRAGGGGGGRFAGGGGRGRGGGRGPAGRGGGRGGRGSPGGGRGRGRGSPGGGRGRGGGRR